MKTIKTLITAALLVSVGTAKAATFNYDFTDSGLIYVPEGPLAGILTGTVTTESAGANQYAQNANNVGVLITNGSSGIFTLNINTKTTTNLGGTVHMKDIVTINGTWDGTTFSATSGGYTVGSCVSEPGGMGCFPNTYTFGSIAGTLTAGGGYFITDTRLNAVNNVHRTDVFCAPNFVSACPAPSIPSAVPIPAAAWLFGSGLIGLAGVTRRKL